MSHFRLDGRILNDPEYLALMRKLEADIYDDSIPCHVPLAASPTLEDITKAAREAFANMEPDTTPAIGSLQAWNTKEVLR